MARLITCGFGVGLIAGEVASSSGTVPVFLTGTPTYNTTTVRAGGYSLRLQAQQQVRLGGAGGATGVDTYQRVYVNFAAFPNSATFRNIFVRPSGYQVMVNNAGTVGLFFGATQIGSLSSALSTGQWYRIELHSQINTGAGVADLADLRIDGTTIASDSGTDRTSTASTNLDVGDSTAATGIDMCVTDIAVNDNSGTNQNSYAGAGVIAYSRPVSDNARVSWTGGGGATTSLFDAVNNSPPVGVALGSATNASQIINSANNNTDAYDANLGAYTTAVASGGAGMGANDTVMLLQPYIHTGNSTTTTQTKRLGLLSNPTIATSTTAGSGATAAATDATGWKTDALAVTYSPVATLGTSPVLRILKGTANTDTMMASQMGLMLEYLPAATRTIANGGGNWSSAGTWVEGVVPTQFDDVVATGTSGNVTIDAASACRSIDLTNYTGTLTHNAAITLSIGTSSPGPSNVALKFPSSGWTYTGLAQASAITFVSTSPTVQTINFGGKGGGNVGFNGINGSWQLTGTMALTNSGGVTLTSGTLDTNGQTITGVGFFSSTSGNLRTLKLGASSITIPGTAVTAVWDTSNTTNLTFDAGTSTITFTGTNPFMNPGALTFNNVSFTGSGSPYIGGTAAATFANLTRSGTSVKTSTFGWSTAPTVTTMLTLTGNSTINRLLVQSYDGTLNTPLPGTQVGITAAAVTLTNVDFMDIKGLGAAQPFTGTGGGAFLGDCGGNSQITFDAPVTQTWSGNTTGNWSTAGSWTSRVPLPQDNVIINGLTSGTITQNMPRTGANVDFTSSTGTLTINIGQNWLVFGNFTLGAGMTITAGANTVNLSGRGSQTFATNGVTMRGGLSLTAPGGTYTLQDNLTISGFGLTMNTGTLDFGGHNVQMLSIFCSGTLARTLTTGSGTVTLTGNSSNTFSINQNTGLTLNFTGTKWIFSGVFSAGVLAINLNTGVTFDTMSFTGSGANFTMFNSTTTVGTLNLTAPSTVTFTSTKTTTLTTFNATGSSGNVITINASAPGSASTLSMASGRTRCDWLALTDSSATGGATWYAGANSTGAVGQNNSGWIFTAPPSGLPSMGMG